MSLLSGLLGNASTLDPARAAQEYARVLGPGEVVLLAFQLIRDVFMFTDKRLIMVDRQGLTGSKIDYNSIPYRSISRFSVETAGTFDLDAELRIWVSGQPVPVQKRFNKQVDVYQVQAVLASMVAK